MTLIHRKTLQFLQHCDNDKIMKIVTNGKGLYALRKGFWPFYKYLDLKFPPVFWKSNEKFYRDCWGEREKVEHWLGILKPQVVKYDSEEEKS